MVEEWIEFVFENIEWDSPRERVRSTPKTPQGRRKIIQPKQFLLSNAYPQPKQIPLSKKNRRVTFEANGVDVKFGFLSVEQKEVTVNSP